MRIDLEKAVLVAFFAAILFLGPGSYLDHTLSHDYPYGYGASDAFQHQVRAEAIKDMGNFKYEASYISKGEEGVVGRYPPVLYHLAVGFSVISGLEVYDSIYAMVLLFSIVGIAGMYVLIREYNKSVALLSLPLSMVMFSFPSSIGFYWGHWPSILAQVFLVLFFWSVSKSAIKRSFILIMLALSIVVLTHTSEAVFGGIFLLLYLGLGMWSRKVSMRQIKEIAAGIALSVVVCSYYLIIFLNTWAKSQPYQFSIAPVWIGNPGFYLTGFGVLLAFIIAGMVISIVKIRESHLALVIGVSMLIGGFMNYAGFDLRSFQLRFFWPIYLGVFCGIGLYMIMKPLVARIGSSAVIGVILLLTVFMSGMISWPVLSQSESNTAPWFPVIKSYGNGMMDKYHWDSLVWLSKNTPLDSTVYFFYGDIYSNDALLRNSKRVHAQVDPEGFVKKLQEHNITKMYLTEVPGDNGGGMATRLGFWSFQDASVGKSSDAFFGEKDVCNYEYLVFDRVSRQQPLAQYNMLIASKLDQQKANVVFSNDAVIIVKNDNIGGECIAEGTF